VAAAAEGHQVAITVHFGILTAPHTLGDHMMTV